MDKSKILNKKRAESVSTGIFELFVYEVIATMAEKHKALPVDKQNTETLLSEIEDFGF